VYRNFVESHHREEAMRRIDRALPESEARELLRKGEYGILSALSADGRPYGVPLSFSYAGDAIYFHCALEGRIVDALKVNAAVSFCVVGKTEVLPEKFSTKYESVIVHGTAAEISGDEKYAGLMELVKKYSPGFIEEGSQYAKRDGGKTRVYKLTIESMTGKARK
jgi:nitroimidazol reductase NimA-like FMN-containing flavoprotein (pyridoxamine 5'-phosphate oxidase superfamily)